MNRIKETFQNKKDILNIYLTAGYPQLNDAVEIVQELAKQGVDMVEVGMPFSDPLADGPVIQKSSEIAIANGITVQQIFEQVQEIRKTVKDLPIFLMGYYNQLIQYGIADFLATAEKVGVDGLIIPDLPLATYQNEHKKLFEAHHIKMSFLITPQTNEQRISEIAQESSGFLYVVSSYAITGGKSSIEESQLAYFKKIEALQLDVPKLIGFGISDSETFNTACKYAEGAIIGSAFIKALTNEGDLKTKIDKFVQKIK